MSVPLWVRKFIVDAVEGIVAAVLVLNLFIPATLAEAQAQAAIIGAAVASACVAAIRRNLPEALVWLRGVLGVATVMLTRLLP